ncbi:hypothetical protein ACNPQM_28935 [Streptomyces sp. NPDC056231]
MNVQGSYSFIASVPYEGLPPVRAPDAAGFNDDGNGADEGRAKIRRRPGQ